MKIRKKSLQTRRQGMKKIGKTTAFTALYLFLTLAFSLPGHLAAQDYTLEATVSENRIFIGEQFVLSVEVSGSSMRNVSLPVLPDLEGVRVLNATPSRSTSISIVNGRTNTTTAYSYNLIARETGTFTIPPVRIEIDGEIKQTDPIQIEIIQNQQLTPDGQTQRPDIYLRIEVDETNLVPGQQTVANLVLYFKQGIEITSFQPTTGWRTDGFWKEELQNDRQPQAESTIIEGVRYRRAVLLRYALFPSRSGQLTLSEFPLNIGVRTQPSRNDPFGSFFGSGANQRRMSVESEPITLTVRPLPAAENAISINAVGDLRVERRLSSREVVTGETLELITTIEGSGNIPLIRKPDYRLPDGLEIYSPQENSNIERRGNTIRGEKTFTELIAPRAPGNFVMPSERVAIYNPQTRNYRYITLPAVQFTATPPAERQLASITGGNQQIRLQPVTGLAIWSNQGQSPIFSSGWFWIMLILPLFILGAAYYQKRISNRLLSDRTFARAHYAVDVANDHINNAKSIVEEGNAKEIYPILHKAVSGFISDKLNLPEAGLSDQELLAKTEEAGVNGVVHRNLRNLLDKCATISYAPTGSTADFRHDIEKTESLIKELQARL